MYMYESGHFLVQRRGGRLFTAMFGGKIRAKKAKGKRSWHDANEDGGDSSTAAQDKKESWKLLKAELEERDRLVADNKRRLESTEEMVSRTEGTAPHPCLTDC